MSQWPGGPRQDQPRKRAETDFEYSRHRHEQLREFDARPGRARLQRNLITFVSVLATLSVLAAVGILVLNLSPLVLVFVVDGALIATFIRDDERREIAANRKRARAARLRGVEKQLFGLSGGDPGPIPPRPDLPRG